MNLEWQASWIWTADEPTRPNQYAHARRTFHLSEAPGVAWLACCADSRYVLYVNGTLIGRGPARYHVSTPSYDTYDVSRRLREGENVIAFLVHHFGCPVFNFMPVRAGLLCQLELPHELIVTDASWRMAKADCYHEDVVRMCLQQAYPEVFDARREPVGWREPGFRDADWPSAVVLGPSTMDPWGELRERDIPHLFEMTVFPESVREAGISVSTDGPTDGGPQSVAALIAGGHHLGLATEKIEDRCAAVFPNEQVAVIHPPGCVGAVYMVIDFAREVVGYPVIEVEGHDGAILDIGYSEVLVDGRVDCYRSQVNYADRCILKDGPQTYQPIMPRAFKYMHIEARNLTEPIRLRAAYIRFSTYPVEYYGSFECSDPVLNQIWDLGTYTTQLCMEDAFLDCPWRERGQWWGDARIEALIGYYAFGDTLLMRRGLRQIAQSQREDGVTHGCYPSAGENILPDFTCIWIISLWEYYLHSGDRALLEELFPGVLKALAWFEQFADEAGVVSDVPHWVFIDWADVDKRGAVAALNCYLLGALRHAQLMAAALGDEERERSFAKQAESLACAIGDRFWSAERRALVDCRVGDELSAQIGQHANALGILFGALDPADFGPALDAVVTPGPDVVQVGTPYFSLYLLHAMYRADRHEQALAYIRDRWGVMLDAGATTCWENWAPTASLCHAWSGGPTYDLSAEFLGVRPVQPGFATFSVRPRCVDLEWMKGIVPTPHGEIHVSWVGRPAGDSFLLDVTAPGGTIAQICVPQASPEHWRTIEANGTRVWREGGGVTSAPEIRAAWSERGYVVFEVEPGEYAFRAST